LKYLWVCVCLCVCVCVCLRVCVGGCMYICIYIYLYWCIHIRLYIFIFIYICIYLYIYIYIICQKNYVSLWIWVCPRVCVWERRCRYIKTTFVFIYSHSHSQKRSICEHVERTYLMSEGGACANIQTCMWHIYMIDLSGGCSGVGWGLPLSCEVGFFFCTSEFEN